MTTFTTYTEKQLGKTLSQASNQEIYLSLLNFVKEEARQMSKNTAKRKVYYISAEFLIGKLLSNNLINLGIYKGIKEELAAKRQISCRSRRCGIRTFSWKWWAWPFSIMLY